jgi:hypothetical protein
MSLIWPPKIVQELMKPYANNSIMSSFKRKLNVEVIPILGWIIVELLNLNLMMKQICIGTTYTDYISEVKMFLPEENYLLLQP